jgi:opacity protein-like surface antigen
MKRFGLMLASALFLMTTAVAINNVYAENESPAVESNMYMRMSSAEHQKKFPHGHKKIKGKQCIYDRETDSYFCQYWKQYDGYINK